MKMKTNYCSIYLIRYSLLRISYRYCWMARKRYLRTIMISPLLKNITLIWTINNSSVSFSRTVMGLTKATKSTNSSISTSKNRSSTSNSRCTSFKTILKISKIKCSSRWNSSSSSVSVLPISGLRNRVPMIGIGVRRNRTKIVLWKAKG